MTLKTQKKSSKTELTCPYCEATFKKEANFAKHICKQKRRFFEKDTKPARFAFHAFKEFHNVHYRRETTYEKFMKSNLYDAFMRFGKYILDIDAIDPMAYIDYMIRSTVPIDRWCRDSEYEKYVFNLTMKECPMRGTERTLLLMQEWANSKQSEMVNFFRDISAPLAVRWIISGRISPWVLLNCESGQELLGRLTDEQTLLIKNALNIKLWKGKFTRHRKEVSDIQAVLAESGI